MLVQYLLQDAAGKFLNGAINVEQEGVRASALNEHDTVN